MITRNSYNKIAEQWAYIRNDSFVSRLVIDFAERISPKKAILDIGCGTGRPLAKYLSSKGFTVTGIDYSEEMIALAQEADIENARFIHCDFFDFKSTSKFDGVLAWDSLWHIPLNKQESIYPRVGELLNPGGYFLFTHGKEEDEHTDKMMKELFYYSSLSKDRVVELLKDSGFRVLCVYSDFIEQKSHRELIILAQKM